LAAAGAHAAEPQDSQAYCTYVMEQARAQSDQLRAPTAMAGMAQSETGLPVQLVSGASLGLSGVKKAGLTMAAAQKDCELYQATVEAQMEILYAQPSLEKEALQNRLARIDEASKSLDALLAETAKMVAAQNATRPMLFALQTTRFRLDADRADTEMKSAALYVPPLSGKPLRELVAAKLDGEAAEQKALDRLSRQNNWDVALSVGIHQQMNPVAQGTQPYGAVSVSYNLASHSINRHLDQAAAAYGEWKKVQESDVARNAEILRQHLSESITVQESRLKTLQEEGKQLDSELRSVATVETSAALDFRNQLTAARLLWVIEVGDTQFRLEHLRAFLAANF
jgi:hypothetical protein